VLSAGTAVSFGVDATAQPYQNENAAYFALTTLCWPILYFVAWKCTTDTNYFKEESVIVPIHVRKEMHIEGVPFEPEEPTTISEVDEKKASSEP
jgi:hypothetical protein